MLIVLSPAKKLDFDSESLATDTREPRLMGDAKTLVARARTLKAGDLKALMGISDALAELNVRRFRDF